MTIFTKYWQCYRHFYHPSHRCLILIFDLNNKNRKEILSRICSSLFDLENLIKNGHLTSNDSLNCALIA